MPVLLIGLSSSQIPLAAVVTHQQMLKAADSGFLPPHLYIKVPFLAWAHSPWASLGSLWLPSFTTQRSMRKSLAALPGVHLPRPSLHTGHFIQVTLRIGRNEERLTS